MLYGSIRENSEVFKYSPEGEELWEKEVENVKHGGDVGELEKTPHEGFEDVSLVEEVFVVFFVDCMI